MNIILDFDGTCVTHVMPGIGVDIGAVPVLDELISKGHKLILFTMRPFGPPLDEAIKWFHDRNLPLFGVQSNPHQRTWTDSPKAHGDLIIDDTALGIPLSFDFRISDKYYVDWVKVRRILIENDII